MCGILSVFSLKQLFSTASSARFDVFRHPREYSAYYTAASEIDTHLLSPTSQLLVRLALERQTPSQRVLGVSTQTPLETLAKERQKNTSLFNQWMAVVSKYPDYPEAKLRAAYYGLKLGKPRDIITQLLDSASPMLFESYAARSLRARIMKYQ